MTRLRHRGARDDSGMTLIELMITSTVLLVLLGMVFVSMDLINTVSTSVTSQYQEFDQALPALAPFHSILAAQIEPGPQTDGAGNPTSGGLQTIDPATGAPNSVPDPAFASIGNFSVTFYADVGTAYANTVSCPPSQTCTSGGTTAGPAKVVAEELDDAGAPATRCTTRSPCSLEVRMYLPETGLAQGPGAPSCPLLWGSTIDLTSTCVYPSTYRLLADVHDVVNDPSQVDASGAPLQPIFSYNVFDTGGTYNGTTYESQGIPLTSAEIKNQTITGLGALGYPVASQSLTACAAPTATYPTASIACPADSIQSVTIDLRVGKPGVGANGIVENSLVVYRYAHSPGSDTAPYQYSETQG